VVSANSQFVIFATTNGTIYRHDLLASNHVNVIVSTNGRNLSASADGNVIAYERVRAGTNVVDLFAVDLSNGQETLVSANVSGLPGGGTSLTPLVSGDGRYIVFQSKAGDLVANDGNSAMDIFVRDRLIGITALVSASEQGTAGNGPSTGPVLGADGRTLLFQSFASDLARADYNARRDVFVLRLGGPDSDVDGLDDDWEVAYFGNYSRDGAGDEDGDGTTDRAEFQAGTDPTDAGSVFRVLTLAPLGGAGQRLIWLANPLRQYRVEYKDDLNSPLWTPLNASVSWNGDTASVSDPGTSTNRFYRVVRLP
jgi:hypothetical protein